MSAHTYHRRSGSGFGFALPSSEQSHVSNYHQDARMDRRYSPSSARFSEQPHHRQARGDRCRSRSPACLPEQPLYYRDRDTDYETRRPTSPDHSSAHLYRERRTTQKSEVQTGSPAHFFRASSPSLDADMLEAEESTKANISESSLEEDFEVTSESSIYLRDQSPSLEADIRETELAAQDAESLSFEFDESFFFDDSETSYNGPLARWGYPAQTQQLLRAAFQSIPGFRFPVFPNRARVQLQHELINAFKIWRCRDKTALFTEMHDFFLEIITDALHHKESYLDTSRYQDMGIADDDLIYYFFNELTLRLGAAHARDSDNVVGTGKYSLSPFALEQLFEVLLCGRLESDDDDDIRSPLTVAMDNWLGVWNEKRLQ